MTADEQAAEVERIARELGLAPAQVREEALAVGLRALAISAEQSAEARMVAEAHVLGMQAAAEGRFVTRAEALRWRAQIDQSRASYEERARELRAWEVVIGERVRELNEAKAAIARERTLLVGAEAHVDQLVARMEVDRGSGA